MLLFLECLHYNFLFALVMQMLFNKSLFITTDVEVTLDITKIISKCKYKARYSTLWQLSSKPYFHEVQFSRLYKVFISIVWVLCESITKMIMSQNKIICYVNVGLALYGTVLLKYEGLIVFPKCVWISFQSLITYITWTCGLLVL